MDIRNTLEVWTATLWAEKHWNLETHLPVIERQFLNLARSVTSWPKPKQFLQNFPRPDYVARPNRKAERTAEELRSVRALIAETRRQLRIAEDDKIENAA